jgi:TonB family protein
MSDSDRIVIKMGLPEKKPETPAISEFKREPRWPLRRWLMFIALVLVAHVAAIFIFGEYRFPRPRPVINAPQIQVAGNAAEWIALDDPTLFVLPHAADFDRVTMPSAPPPAFRWTEAPRWLPLSAQNLGAAFARFMQTNSFDAYPLDFKPSPKMNVSSMSLAPAVAGGSTLRMDNSLAARRLSGEVALPDLPYSDVIRPTKVQAAVNADGSVLSVVLLDSSGYKDADERALEIARAIRFKPSRHPTIGQMSFDWRTVPPAANNSTNNP